MGDFWNEADARKSRKDHKCIWCGQVIAKGAHYIFQSGVFEGDWQSNHWHDECYENAGDVLLPFEEFTPWSNERPVLEGA